MNTDELIRAIVADNPTMRPPIRRTLAVALALGTAAAAVIFIASLGARSDFWWSIVHSPRFAFKFVFTLAVAVPAFFIVRNLMRPDAGVGAAWVLAIPFVMLAAAVAAEMIHLPRDHWAVYAVGSNALYCVSLIPFLALAPLIATFYALKQGAPANPAAAGALGGLLSAAIGATLYAAHCSDDSPLFVSIWYPIGMALVTLAGAVLGARLLRW